MWLLFQKPISDSINCKKKALIKYLVNIQSSAEKCILYTEAEAFISPTDLSQTPAFSFQVFKAKSIQKQNQFV